MKAALDENLSRALADALDKLASARDEDEILHVSALVPRGTPDVELFTALQNNGVTVHITQDHHHRKQLEAKAIAKCGLIVFVLSRGWSRQPHWEKAIQLIRWWPLIREHASRMSPPAVFEVPWNMTGKRKFRQVPL